MTTEQERTLLLREKADRDRQAEKDLLNAEKARRSFSHFFRCVWPIVEPGMTLIPGWYLDCIDEHIEAVFRGQIGDLAICVPPGTAKTTKVLEAFPAWGLIQNPGLRFLCGANSEKLATKSSSRCRSILRSDWYQKYFPEVEIADDIDRQDWFGTTRLGFRKTFIVNGLVTGERGDFLLIDDPNDASKVLSATNRQAVNEWYDSSAWDRIRSPKHSHRIMIAQRTHRKDLIGHCIERHGYTPLVLPEEYDPARRCTTVIFQDPRKEKGELLRPEIFGPKQVEQAKKTLGFQAKYNQNPTDEENAVYKPEYLRRRWHWHPSRANVIVLEASDADRYEFDVTSCPLFAACDAAADAKSSSDDTALGVYQLTPRGDLVWRHLYCRKLDIPEQPELLAEAWHTWRFGFIAIEAVGANRAMFQFAQRMGLSAIPMSAGSADKLVRANAAITRAAQGRLWLPDENEAPDFDVAKAVDQLLRFTGRKGEPDDIADQLSWACIAAPHAARFAGGDATATPVAVSALTGDRFPTAATLTPRFGHTAAVSPDSVTGGGRVMPWS